MKQVLKKRIFILLITYIAFMGWPLMIVHGEETTEVASTAQTGSFTYEVVKPENQLSNSGYFDLKMTAGQKQTVHIELTNPSNQTPVTVAVSLNSTKTNSNGVLEYGPAAIETDASLNYDFKDIVKGPETVALQPGETKALELEITMPEETYDGVISGGIQLQVELTEEAKVEREKQTGIVNDYAYLIGMLLKETDKEISPDLKFNSIKADLSNYRNAIFVNFSNTEMTFIGGMTVDFQVMKRGSDEILYDTKKAEMSMAPNSMINFPLLMGGDEMVAGDYTGHILVTVGEQQWEWTEDFTITQEEADKYNKQDVSLVQERGMNWMLIIGIVAGSLLLLGIIFAVVHQVNKKKKKKKASKKGKKSSKR